VPVPGPGEVLLRTRAVGVNAIDWKSRAGTGLDLELPAVLGWDVSGTVTALGPGVEAFTVDDEVFGMIRFPEPGRAYAEYVTAPSDQLVARPEAVDPITAAAVPMCSVTAWKALFTHGRLQPGQRVLVHGAAGGVGHLAIQLAKHGGAVEVIGTGSAASHDFVIGLGADQVVDYTQVPLGSAGTDLDLVIDTRGGKDLIELLDVLRPGGTVVSLLGQEPEADRLAAERGLRTEYVYVSPDVQALAEVAKLLVTGELQVPVEKVLPLEQAAEAHAIGDAGHVRGRLVLNVS
jgi:NADPH:quinone reductase-like Zn-dependent oxidoreductase